MADQKKVCGACRWWNTGFCSSVEVMQHLERESGTWRNFIAKDASGEPLLKRCWLRRHNPVTSTPGPRAPHSAPSSMPEPPKTSAIDAVDRSIKGEVQ